MIDTIEKQDCTGCKMCGDLCPAGAISFAEDNEGFWYPEVDPLTCTKCGLCVKRCPSLNPVALDSFEVPAVYAAWSKHDNVRLGSTSGGAFWEISKPFIERGGAVVGCRYTSDWKGAEHAIARNASELAPLMISKYVQSDTKGIYKKVRECIHSGTPVLFCGTPCQCAAMLAYVGEEREGLFLQDFICRTINSPLAFRKYVEELEKNSGSKIASLRAKSKETGWGSLAYHAEFENGAVYHKDRRDDPFVRGMIGYDLYQRESCYHCKYRGLPRCCADYTLGDFWGIKGQSDEDMFKGISAVIVNTTRGGKLLEGADDTLHRERRMISDVIPGNPALLKNPTISWSRDLFFSSLSTMPFSEAFDKCVAAGKMKGLPERFAKKGKKMASKLLKAVSAVYRGDLSPTKYIKYNYLTKAVKRHDGAKIIPSRGAVLSAPPGAIIELFGDIRLCTNHLKGSKAEACVKVEPGGAWLCAGNANLMAGSRVEVKRGALLDTRSFSANDGTVMVAAKSITLGEDVMMGRNNIIYDSDFHIIRSKRGRPLNPPEPVVIGDHVWITSDVTVMKGVTIGSGSIVTAKATISKDVPGDVVYGPPPQAKVLSKQMSWERTLCSKLDDGNWNE